jgi:hypothetical protein
VEASISIIGKICLHIRVTDNCCGDSAMLPFVRRAAFGAGLSLTVNLELSTTVDRTLSPFTAYLGI